MSNLIKINNQKDYDKVVDYMKKNNILHDLDVDPLTEFFVIESKFRLDNLEILSEDNQNYYNSLNEKGKDGVAELYAINLSDRTDEIFDFDKMDEIANDSTEEHKEM